ncbi:TPA: phage tail spike protein [Streptococcus suis]
MIYLFDKDEKLIKIVRKSAVKTALQKYALTTERYVSDRLTVELKGLNADELEQVEYMAIQTMEDAHAFHYFYVAQKFSDELTTLIGVQSGIEELRKSPVFDKRPKNAFARDVIADLLAGTNWQARFVGETTPHSTNFYYTSIFDALKKVCEVWDLEMQFFVEMNSNRIGARYIDFKQKIGQAVGKRVVYGHNALQILQEVERTNIFTALVGRGKGEETGDGYGRKITFEDAVWSRTQGKPVDKPKGQKYLELPLMTRQYGIKNVDGSMRPKIGFVDFSEEENPEVLIERTYKALIDAARPQLTLKTSSVYLKGVKVGDTIRVVRHDKKLDYDTRIFEITFNRLNNQSSDIKLGDRIGESNEAKVQTIADKAVEQFVANEFSNFVQNLPDYLPSADGFNNNWYGAEDPTVKYPGKVLINDIWYKPDPEHEGHKIMLRWTGEVWEEILRTYESEALRDRIAEEVAKVNETMQANEAERQRQIDDLLLKAGANKSLAEEAKKIGDQAKLEAADALSKALQYKNEAIAEATRLDTVERQATETKLATAKSQAVAEATQLINTAKTTLETQIGSANKSIADAKKSLETQISSVSTEITKTNDTIKTLATKTDIDATNRRVTTAETSLTQQAGQIALKANQTDVNDVKSRLQTAESSLQVQADQISQRVKTSDFDQAEQRISTAESSITQLGNRITTEISETVAKIPTEIGTNNLFILSGSTKGIYKSNLHQDVKSLRYAYGPKILIDSQATYTLQSWSNILNDFSWLGYSQLDSNGVQIPNTYVTIYPARLQKYYRRDIITHNSAKYIQFSFSDDVFGDTPNLKIKLEKGMIASDWSPAPEDAVAEIENVKTAITQTTYGQEQLSTKLTEMQGKVTIAETNIRQLVNVVSSKVSQETFDNLKRTVDSQGTSISQNQSAIALKAEKTYVDGVKTTADSALSKANANADSIRTAKAELKVTSDAVATKVSQSDFNAVDQRLTSAETTIRTQAGLIEQRLTSTQVESLVVGKGYATSTVVQNLVKETSDAFKKSISETKKLIPTNFDNTNLLSVSNLKNGWFDNEGILRLTTMYVSTDYIELDSNTSYIWQTWTKSSNWAGLVLFDSQKQYITGSYRSVTVDSYVKQTIESGNAKYIVFSFDKSILDGAIKSKLEKGAIATEWVPAYQDLVSTTEFHEVADTVDSHKRTISEQGKSISQVIQTANGLVTKVSALDKSDNLFSFEKSTKGFWIDRNGSVIAGKTYSHSDFLKLASDGTYQLQVWNKSTDKKWIGFTKYTSDKSYISGSYSSFEIESNGYKLLSFTNFDGYLIISYGSYTTDNMTGLEIQFERGLVATAYKLSTLDFATQTQVNTLAGSWAVKNLTSSGTVLNQLNLNKDGSVKIDGSLVQITGKTYIQDGVITSAKIGKGQIGTAHIGEIDAGIAKIINLDVSNIKGLDAEFIKAKIENAFIEWMKGKTITAQNEAMTIGLNDAFIRFKDNAKIEFQSENNTLYRTKNGTSAFIHFRDDSYNGVYTAMGVNADNTGTQNDYSSGSFAGVRVIRSNPSRYSGTTVDQVQLVGDEIRIRHGYGYENDYLVIKWDNQGKIDLIKFLRSVASKLGLPLT